MKVKTWLMISYLVIMLLPILFSYLFYSWLQGSYEKQAFEEFLATEVLMGGMDKVLQQPTIFSDTKGHLEELNSLVTPSVGLTLFSPQGEILYANPREKWRISRMNQTELYQDLNRLKTGLRAFTIKKPVFYKENMIGIYEVNLIRSENIQKVERKQNLMIGLLLFTFMMVYLVMIYLVNRKLIQPMKKLMTQMEYLGSGKKVEKLEVGKDEIGDLNRHFEKMRNMLQESQDKIKQTQKEKEYMIASISHDLKTPLTSIRAYSESVLYNPLSEQDKKDYLEIIVEKVDYMKRMFDDLTTYTLLQNSERPAEKVIVESEELFDMLFSGYEEVCSRKHINLTTDIQTFGMAEVNINQLTRVVDNLFSNALKYTNPEKRIWLGAYSMEAGFPQWIFQPFKERVLGICNGVTIIVQNEGSIIPQEEQEKIFQPLYQVEESRTKRNNGTGLGLSIVKMIIDKHKGSIRVFSEQGYGTTIVCCLPAYKGDYKNEKV
jgi:signal transduction histidine kinase